MNTKKQAYPENLVSEELGQGLNMTQNFLTHYGVV
jgi:hypothetical protein